MGRGRGDQALEEYNLSKVLKTSILDLDEIEEAEYRKYLIIARLESKRNKPGNIP